MVYFDANIAPTLILGASCFSIFWGIINAILIRRIDMDDHHPIESALREAQVEVADHAPREDGELEDDEEKVTHSPRLILHRIQWIGDQITRGAISFLNQEYLYLGIFAAVFAIILGVTVDAYEMSRDDAPKTNFPYTAVAFLVGSGTSILAGYIGMRIAVYTNTRTTFQCCAGEFINVRGQETKDLQAGFFTAFRGGQVLGFVLVGLALLILEVIVATFRATWFDGALNDEVVQAYNTAFGADAATT